MVANKKKKIGALLIERGYVTAGQVKHALEVQKSKRERLGNILIELGYLDEHKFHEFLSNLEGVASIDLGRYEIDRSLLDLLAGELALRFEAVPIGRIRNLLTVAMVYPLDSEGIKVLEESTGLKVKAVLCSRSAIYRALDRYYGRSRAMKARDLVEPADPRVPLQLPQAAELVKRVHDLPTLPDIIHAVSAIVNDPKSSAADLAKVIATDAALSARVLRLANAPIYGFSRKIGDIKHAIALLGFKETQALAVSVSAFNYMLTGGDFDFKSYWNHSFACATLAKLLAANVHARGMESAFVAGLLHDIGKAALATNIFANHRSPDYEGNLDISSLDVSEEALGITHAEIGYLLAERWLLPPLLTGAIRYHHMPEQQPTQDRLAGVIFLADLFCKKETAASGEDTARDEQVAAVLNLVGLSEPALAEALRIYQDVASEISIF